jgi:uncharacterized NAD-dependent epimerase/dehydratase family protein
MTPLINLPQPYLVFIGGAHDLPFAKTARGLRDWSPELCIGEMACAGESASIGLPAYSPRTAHALGARALVIGVANVGGLMRDSWVAALLESLESGLDIISGLHGRLEEVAGLKAAAARYGRQLINLRVPPRNIPVGSGIKRTGRRLLTVGTDCALGKKYTALTLTREFKNRAVDADFRATGQTGILIAGSGIPIDAVVSDFVAGAAEMLSPDAHPDHWDVVEGQGSIFHPSYAGVSLGLLHGTQADVLVLCHEVGRDRVLGLDHYPTPSIREAIEVTLMLARRTNPRVRCVGVSLNTALLDESAARTTLAQHAAELHLPVADPLRPGAELDQLINACLD